MRKQIQNVLLYFALFLFALLFILPTIWMLISSFKSTNVIYEQLNSLSAFLPIGDLSLDSYNEVFDRFNILNGMKNSLVYAFFAVSISLTVNSMCGYALAKFKVPFKKGIFSFFILLLIFPFESIFTQLYVFVNNLGLTNSIMGVVIPFVASPFITMLFYGSFLTFPNEIIESAYVDGATNFKIFTSIIVPNNLPTYATAGIFVFLGSWNDFLWPTLVITDTSKYPIQVAINLLNETEPVVLSQVLSALTIATLPVAIIYIFAQKYISPTTIKIGDK